MPCASRTLAALLPLCLLGPTLSAQTYDLLLKNGHVIDAKNKISGKRDVAIKDGKIAEVAADIAASKAAKVVDVAGLYVTPGLVDLHVHVYASAANPSSYCGALSVFPDDHTFRNGVTTAVDAGTSGWKSFEEFKTRIIDKSRTRVLALLNVIGTGMCGSVEQDVKELDAQQAAAMAKKYPQTIVGFKTAHYAGPEWVAVDAGLAAGRATNLPLMVDFGSFRLERPFETLVLDKLRPGDMYTHMYLNAVPMLDKDNKVREFMWQARKRGVLFDAGHGAGSFVWWQAVPAMKQGFPPDSISTDLHASSMNAGMKGMLNVMSKFLAMGMPLDEVILKSTWNPARQIHREELGNLSVGAPADVAVIRLTKGDFGFVDVNGGRLKGTQMLSSEITLRDGKVQYDQNGLTRDDWDKIGGRYAAQGSGSWDATIGQAVRARKK
ncbi:MAG: amidohydrolase/deacetylase family metallohydrolase [Acidobacteria bacterium]|nr:amidohydrolase/deacetylase family metallohydrolase [Acidobacteriota bacterium]